MSEDVSLRDRLVHVLTDLGARPVEERERILESAVAACIDDEESAHRLTRVTSGLFLRAKEQVSRFLQLSDEEVAQDA